MAQVRACTGDDIPGVARLFLKAFKKGDGHSLPVLAAYLHRLYFENPWIDPEMPSLVIDRGGMVSGFIGVMPMPLRLDGRSIRAAVGGNLMVDPEVADPLSAVRLLRRFFDGPQDLAFTDTANVKAVKLWSGFGGVVSRFHTMRWFVPLRPGSLGLVAARRHPVVSKVAWLGPPIARSLDRMTRRQLVGGPADALRLVEVGADRVLGFISPLGDTGYLHLDTSPAGFDWLVAMCHAKKQFGPMKIMAMQGADGRDVGVVIYYPNRGGLGQVVLALAREGRHEALLDALCRDAAHEGSAALMGQADPRLMIAIGDRVSVYTQRNEFVTLRSADPSIASRIASADVSINRLCGEWWTRLQGDQF